MRCITGARFNMEATILRQVGEYLDNQAGQEIYVQDPDSGAIIRKWTEDSDSDSPGVQTLVIPCSVRGVLNGGIRAAGTTQRFGEIYQNVDWGVMTLPAGITLTRGDRVTKISDNKGTVIWVEEEIPGRPSTTFIVMGTTPVIGPFGNLMYQSTLIQRAEVQNA